ncbi:glycine-rich domain-containing protein [Streptomyces sp. NPDC088560]|uniref:glycine-rich domain-containing protein n=1 Tax=Streptomyces sp. NPDC088560 TaxID=3365868 RepID=UPI0037F2529C
MIPPGPDPKPDPLAELPRMLITDDQFTSCRLTVMDANPDMPANLASRIVEEALKFVAACSRNPGGGLVPSRIVDEGWHALILHTAMYADLCDRLGDQAGSRFVHHYPGYAPENYDPSVLDRTREKIAELGWAVDTELWVAPSDETLVSVAAKCQHSDDSGPIVTMPKPKPGGVV